MCWNHDMFDRSWTHAARRREPARARAAEIRVSDAERDEVVQALSRHTGDGRLTFEEFEERVGEAYAAKTRRELDATLRNLPRPVARTPRRRLDVADRLRPLVAIALLVLTVAVLGPWVLWVGVPLIWFRVVGRHHHRRHHELEDPRPDEDELTLV